MKAPEFWRAGRGGVGAALLTPASWLYALGAAIKKGFAPPPWQAPVPVICIGNVTVGGSGKTPVAIDVAKRLTARGLVPHVLTRGYGGTLEGPLRVDASKHNAADVGDEALLLAAHAPTWVGADRTASTLMATQAGARALVMDDGFQNPAIAKDLSILVFDGGFGIGNGRLLPAGPLREPMAAALERARAAVCLGADETGILSLIEGRLPTLTARLVATDRSAELKGGRFVAFAGIGRPRKFFATLADAGIDVVDTRTFADHHPFSKAELSELRARASELDAALITTEKDLMRIPADNRFGIEVLTVRVEWDDESMINTLLSTAIEKAADAG